ncbi:MAG: helix-turn-helix domain-containing protein [Bacteroidia bacterium]|nr:helix-turn-helix domain-containing protein [Bacteroidia bacterium]
MHYKEIHVPDHFSRHVEIYWEMQIKAGELNHLNDLLLPDCTFNIIFTDQDLFIKAAYEKLWKCIPAGVHFLGQRNTPLSFRVKKSIRVFGIRFKPFAFANILDIPVHKLTDQFLVLSQLFKLKASQEQTIKNILRKWETDFQCSEANVLLASLLEDSLSIDQNLRAQLNYILDRKGVLRVQDLFTEFGVSKVTLHKHFINKVGLSPKKVSRIWRMNYFLQLKNTSTDENLTSLCLECGFYDQAHFIKEFKSMLGSAPREFLGQKSELLEISRFAIQQRFSNQYDPR